MCTNRDIVLKASVNADEYLGLKSLCVRLGISQSGAIRLGLRRLLRAESNYCAKREVVNRPKTGRSARRLRVNAPLPLRL